MKKPMKTKKSGGKMPMVKDKDADGYKKGGMVKSKNGKAC